MDVASDVETVVPLSLRDELIRFPLASYLGIAFCVSPLDVATSTTEPALLQICARWEEEEPKIKSKAEKQVGAVVSVRFANCESVTKVYDGAVVGPISAEKP